MPKLLSPAALNVQVLGQKSHKKFACAYVLHNDKWYLKKSGSKDMYFFRID